MSDHTLLTVDIVIIEEHIQTKKYTIIKKSEEEKNFLAELIKAIKRLNMDHISSKEILEQTAQEFADNTEKIWFKHLKTINITKHLKPWWNEGCQRELERYRVSK